MDIFHFVFNKCSVSPQCLRANIFTEDQTPFICQKVEITETIFVEYLIPVC